MSTHRRHVSSRELRERLAGFLKAAEEGTEISITVRGREVARLVPPRPARLRPFGLLAGQIEIAPDFDATPDEIVDAMEGKDEG